MTIPPISPESRAEALADELMGKPLTVPSQERKAWFARRVAQAIREAENAAYEMAANHIWPEGKPIETSLQMVEKAFADKVRSLRHKDTP